MVKGGYITLTPNYNFMLSKGVLIQVLECRWLPTGGLQHHNFLIFDGKQHPKNIWFHVGTVQHWCQGACVTAFHLVRSSSFFSLPFYFTLHLSSSILKPTS